MVGGGRVEGRRAWFLVVCTDEFGEKVHRDMVTLQAGIVLDHKWFSYPLSM